MTGVLGTSVLPAAGPSFVFHALIAAAVAVVVLAVKLFKKVKHA